MATTRRTRRTSSSRGRSSQRVEPKTTRTRVVDQVTAYARAVVAGRIVAGPHVRDACARHLRDLEHGPQRGLKWDKTAVDRVIRYFATVLRLNGGEHEGKPFILQPSQAFIVGSIFGWRLADGTRRFRIAYVETGKGNGKSPMAAGIGHYMASADGESRAEVYAAAVDREQAGILFRDAVAMAKQSPALLGRVVFSGGAGREHNIAYPHSHSFFRPISSESSGRGKSGFRPHCVLLDEIHEHPTPAMIEFLRANTKGRTQPLVFMITNSGFDRASVCWEYHDYATKVASGAIEDDSFFSYVCALDEGEDPFDEPADRKLGYPKCWLKANPLLGVTIKPSYLEEQIRQARGMPSKQSIVRRLNFCQWVGAENPWIDEDAWRACEFDYSAASPEERATFDAAFADRVYVALDLSSRGDLTAGARVAFDPDGNVCAEIRAWTPRDTAQTRALRDRVPYVDWIESGHLIGVPRKAIDYDFVVRDLADWLMDAEALAFDPWRIYDLQNAFDAAGVDCHIEERPDDSGPGIALIPHGQGFGGGAQEGALWMPRSIELLEQLVLQRQLRVKKNPVLTWANASAVTQTDAANNRKWEKRKSTGRIDPLVALCMAVGLAISRRDPDAAAAPQIIWLDDGPATGDEVLVSEEDWW